MKYSKAIAANTDFLTAQSFVFEKDECLATFIISASGEDIFTKVRMAGLSSQDQFLASDADVPTKIESVVAFLKSELTNGREVHVLIAVLKENALYLQGLGRVQAFLRRGEKVINLLTNPNQLVSGFLEKGDKLLLMGARMVDTEVESPVWSTELINSLFESPLEELEDQLEGFLQSHPGEASPLAVTRVDSPPDAIAEDKESSIPGSAKAAEPSLKRRPSFKIPVRPIVRGLLTLILLNKKTKIISLVVFLLVLGISTALILNSQKGAIQAQSVNSHLEQASQKINEAVSIRDSDFDAAKERLQEARIEVAKALQIDPQNNEAKSLSAQIELKSLDILRAYPIGDFPLFLSLDLIKKDFSADRLSFSVGEILVLDKNQKSLVSINIDKKSNQVLAGVNNLGQAISASLNGDKAFAFSADKGVFRVDLITQKGVLATKPDSEWGRVVDIYAFGGNFYLLDSLKNQIWKYVPIEQGYAEKTTYIQSETADLAGAKMLQIDASVWVLKGGREVVKYTNGDTDSFFIAGLDKNLGAIKSFFVSSDTERVYFLDPENSRVVLLEKSGKYHSQYIGEKFATADDLVVDEVSKKLYLLEGNKIYQIELR